MKFITYGCKLNQAETAKWRTANIREEGREIIIINSCSVTAYASKEVRKKIRNIRRNNPEARIYVTGCMDATIRKVAIENEAFIIPKSRADNFFDSSNGYCYPENNRAFIPIQKGCHRFCRYCIVPYLREKPISYSYDRIASDIDFMINRGYEEIVLTGTHIGLYNYSGMNLSSLLKYLYKRFYPQIRIRLGSLEVFEIDNDLFDLFKGDFLTRHVHLSLQSLNSNLLKIMGRTYTFEDINRVVERFHKMGVFIGIDIIIGYPLETDEMFHDTLNKLKKLPLSFFHVFKYSQRAGTLAALLPPIEDNLVLKRLKILNNIIREKKRESLDFLPVNEEIVIEKTDDNFFYGRLSNYMYAFGNISNEKEKRRYKVKIEDSKSYLKDGKIKVRRI